MGSSGGHRKLPGGSDHFSWHTDKHCIIIYISSPWPIDHDIQDNPAAMDLRENCFNRTDECCKDATFSPEAKIILIFTSNHLTRVEISSHLFIWTRGPSEQILTQSKIWVKICQMFAITNEKAQIIWINSDNLSPLGPWSGHLFSHNLKIFLAGHPVGRLQDAHIWRGQNFYQSQNSKTFFKNCNYVSIFKLMIQTHLSTGRKCSFNLQFGMHMEVCRIVIICIITIIMHMKVCLYWIRFWLGHHVVVIRSPLWVPLE